MLRINSYDEYSAVLSAFKQNKSRCDTNKIRTREEITDLIEAGKLFYEENDGVLWLFVDEGYYYYANFYAPRGLPLHITKQNLNVVTDIVGTLERYNSQS